MQGPEQAPFEVRGGWPRRLWSSVLDVVLPPRCLGCGDGVDRQGALCAACWSELSFITPPLCRICGLPLPYAAVGDGLCEPCLDEPPVYDMARAALRYDANGRRLALANGTALREVCDARTFTTTCELERLRAAGLGRGGDLGNAVVYGPDGVLNPDGLRHPDEAVRHKILDAMGDLALAGAPILGRYVGERAGHALTGRLLSALFATEGAVERVAATGEVARHLPGAGLGQGDLAAVA